MPGHTLFVKLATIHYRPFSAGQIFGLQKDHVGATKTI